MGVEPSSSHFTDFRRYDPNGIGFGHTVVLKAYPVGMVPAMNDVIEDEGESRLEPYVGLEFDSADEAREFYNLYARRVGFKIRTGQLYRSRTNGTVSSRRFVCSKEGFQLNSRTGCPALIKVQRRDSGKWVVDLFLKDHNHELGLAAGESPPPPPLLQKTSLTAKSVVTMPHRPRTKLIEEAEDGRPSPSGIINIKRLKRDGEELQPKVEPFSGLEFNSANEAYQFYQAYAASKGFSIRIGQLFRSKLDGSITSRRFVCSKEGFQHPSRLGCGAFMRIKRQESGRWVVDRLQKGHNHELELQLELHKKSVIASKRKNFYNLMDILVSRFMKKGPLADIWCALMVWSLRETASKYIEAGAASFEKHKLAYEIMREGGRKLCWQSCSASWGP
ncbi:hypothetical protein G4B88_007786 [Cannabis sativa]|uniref:FAR1 domain-containing protein n=1 Tax=Cannabis sativa TaxID=3483 RepID=A0A7J6HHD6_CANSA|nr:hypothetical protein G4B88_007786 [Cannabis sativa]